jgi:hypothetical protein
MSFETKARIELVSVILGILVLFSLPVILIGMGV